MSESPEQVVVDPVLRAAVREIETHSAEAGWDQPARLYALVPTADLVQREPSLAAAMGLTESDGAGSLTPVEQDQVAQDKSLESVLEQIMWPAEVFGCAAVVERLVLPPGADDQLPDDAAQRGGLRRAAPGPPGGPHRRGRDAGRVDVLCAAAPVARRPAVRPGGAGPGPGSPGVVRGTLEN